MSLLRSPGEIPQEGPAAGPPGQNILKAEGPPPTAAGIGGKGGPGPAKKKPNPRGLNRGGKVNTNVSANNTTPEAQTMTQTLNTKQ